MKCANCGTEFSNDYKFCPACATPIQDTQKQAESAEELVGVTSNYQSENMQEYAKSQADNHAVGYQQNENEYSEYVSPQASSAPVKKKPKWKLPVAIIFIIIVLLGGVFAGLYFGTDIFAKGDGKCDLCEKEISKKDTYCAECIEKNTCKECKEFDLDSVDGYCSNCRKCRGCGEDLKKGFYCKECIDELSYVDNYLGLRGNCVSCFFKNIKEDATFVSSSYILKNRLQSEEIFFIDKNGFIYCRECESKKLCKGCEGFLTEDDDDDVCLFCVTEEYDKTLTVCFGCSEVVSLKNGDADCKNCKDCKECGSKIRNNDSDGLCTWCSDLDCSFCGKDIDEDEIGCEFKNEYDDVCHVCKECYSGKYCEECEEIPLEKDNSTQRCYDCAEYICYDCGKVLTKKMISYTSENEYNYCKDCDTKNYCKDCDKVLSIYDCDKTCTDCADYACDDCGEVLKKKEISYEFEDGDEEYTICKLCDSGNYCKRCESILSKYDDDKMCSNCADYICWQCDEVLRKKEISYEYERWEDSYYICKACDTGKYCEECGYMLEKNDDDDVCSECADHTCWQCGEVLRKKEISYENGYKFYCEECDTDKYCYKCSDVLEKEDDDKVCYSCADYSCWQCYEVLGEGEISYSFTDEYGDESYYCEDCDTGAYCNECNRVIYDDYCWFCE